MPRNLDIALLRTFVHIVESGSMTATAAQLHMTQGAVSQQIKRLEEALGCAVLERDRRGIRLTTEGRRLLDRATKMVAINDQIWADMRMPEMRGKVRLGVPYDLVGTHLPRALQSYARSYPNVEVSLVSGTSVELREALAKGKLDLALVEERLGASEGEYLAVDRLVWVGQRAGNAYTKRPLPICLAQETCVFRPAIFDALERHAIEWRVVFDDAGIDAIALTLRSDLAVTAWLATTVPADLAIIDPDAGLPALPDFAIRLMEGKGVSSQPCDAMAVCIRQAYRERQPAEK
jgi:DNA-binding transcriptional LysR family regulator